jgi:lactoylglutathione lyase
MILRISHLSITVDDIQVSIDFYQNVLGARLINTPSGASRYGIQWMAIGQNDAIKMHLIPRSSLVELEKAGLKHQLVGNLRSAVDHFAFEVDQIPEVTAFKQLVESNAGSMNPTGIPYAYDETKQLFIADPDGYRIELCLF